MSNLRSRGPQSIEESRNDLLDQLETKVLALQASPAWTSYLRAQARFHTYSPRNVMLIALQNPSATAVAGYSTWKALGRFVNKDERGISILAPIFAPLGQDEERHLAGFRWVTVFDIAQTTGSDLPSPVSILGHSDPGTLEDDLATVAEAFGFTVRYDRLPQGVNGECRWAERVIVIDPDNPALQRTKTLVHELAHGILHEHHRDRSTAEVEAESVAFVVLGARGLDTSAYSTGYVASWIGPDGDPSDAIKHSCSAIQRAAALIIDGLEAVLGADGAGQTEAVTH